jgi:ABC-type transport system involved in multi-copper enzyme maturation permease subunit
VSKPAMLGLVRKEARALWPAWIATAAVCLVAGISDQSRFVSSGLLTYFVGSVVLAALAIGHEYTNGTLPALLSLPVDRRRLLLAKLLAMLSMLITLAPLGLWMVSGRVAIDRGLVDGALSLVTAIALAPWLTMVCRSPLAGSVFALGVAGGLHLLSLGVVVGYVELAGLPSMQLQAFGDRILAGLLIACAIVAIAGTWRWFMTLEAVDGRGTDLAWPRWLRSSMALDEEQLIAPARRSRPYWLLVKKELHLQQLSMFVAAINVVIWLLSSLLVAPSPEATAISAVLAVLYGVLLAMLIGALASAEERHLGTLEWQLLMPIAVWKQFAVKTAVAFGLSAVLCFGLQAVVLATPAMFLMAGAVSWSWARFDIGRPAGLGVVAVLAALAWWYAFVNHRTARR